MNKVGGESILYWKVVCYLCRSHIEIFFVTNNFLQHHRWVLHIYLGGCAATHTKLMQYLFPFLSGRLWPRWVPSTLTHSPLGRHLTFSQFTYEKRDETVSDWDWVGWALSNESGSDVVQKLPRRNSRKKCVRDAWSGHVIFSVILPHCLWKRAIRVICSLPWIPRRFCLLGLCTRAYRLLNRNSLSRSLCRPETLNRTICPLSMVVDIA